MPKRRPEDPDAVLAPRVEVVPRRGLNRQEAARYVGISAAKFDELVREGLMPQPFRIGSRVIWDLRKVDDAFDALSEPEKANPWDDWDASSQAQSKASQKERLAKADAAKIQARKDTKRPATRIMMSEDYPGHPNVYDPTTLAERWRCSVQHVRNMIRRGELEAFLHGGVLTRISPATVIAYEKANTIHAKR
ncbi:helix-turn-helix domain-containing protein [Methylobacterium sp. J-070]|uniref:helix-turn-helix domain-containing protein n=1 Tax=Methylobacterium sp. J-070 TaxID=2836650 RepID=UPI00244508C0|nr:helix-turn-helix domain-containing protein [Methylobacterium sp. J-070]